MNLLKDLNAVEWTKVQEECIAPVFNNWKYSIRAPRPFSADHICRVFDETTACVLGTGPLSITSRLYYRIKVGGSRMAVIHQSVFILSVHTLKAKISLDSY